MLKKIGRNDPCWCGSGKKYKDCHLALDEKINSYKLKGWKIPPKKIIKRPDQIDGIRESGLVNIAVLDYVAENIHAGMSTEDIDRLVAEKTKELGGIAAPLNYEGFPKSVCTSINDAVCHGIPNEEEILQDGDIINVDVSTIYKGYFSDSSRMFCIGEVDDVSKKLVEDTLKAVQLGLSEVRPFNRLGRARPRLSRKDLRAAPAEHELFPPHQPAHPAMRRQAALGQGYSRREGICRLHVAFRAYRPVCDRFPPGFRARRPACR